LTSAESIALLEKMKYCRDEKVLQLPNNFPYVITGDFECASRQLRIMASKDEIDRSTRDDLCRLADLYYRESQSRHSWMFLDMLKTDRINMAIELYEKWIVIT